ncbi:hypothetical protein CPB86DRAFT_820925 [Serendipita vermifera]|nr:hypothetical protein CPB86DRAFT_820925 [Serendipita vermifera]
MFVTNPASSAAQGGTLWGYEGSEGPTNMPNHWTPSSPQRELLHKLFRNVTHFSQLTRDIVDFAVQALSSLPGGSPPTPGDIYVWWHEDRVLTNQPGVTAPPTSSTSGHFDPNHSAPSHTLYYDINFGTNVPFIPSFANAIPQQADAIPSGLRFSDTIPPSDASSPAQEVTQIVDRAQSVDFPYHNLPDIPPPPADIPPPTADNRFPFQARASALQDPGAALLTLFDDPFTTSINPYLDLEDDGHDTRHSSPVPDYPNRPLHPSLNVPKNAPRKPLEDVTSSSGVNHHRNERRSQRPSLKFSTSKKRPVKKEIAHYYKASKMMVKDRQLNMRERLAEVKDNPEFKGQEDVTIRAKLVRREWDDLDKESRQVYQGRAKEAAAVPIPTKELLNRTLKKMQRPGDKATKEGRFAYLIVAWVPGGGGTGETTIVSKGPAHSQNFSTWLASQPKEQDSFDNLMGKYGAPLWVYLQKRYKGALSDGEDDEDKEELTTLSPVKWTAGDRVSDLRDVLMATMNQRWKLSGRKGHISWRKIVDNPSAYYNFESLPTGWSIRYPGAMRANELLHNLEYLQKGDKGELPEGQRFQFIPLGHGHGHGHAPTTTITTTSRTSPTKTTATTSTTDPPSVIGTTTTIATPSMTGPSSTTGMTTTIATPSTANPLNATSTATTITTPSTISPPSATALRVL